MSSARIVKFEDATRHSMSPTEAMHVLLSGSETQPDVCIEELGEGDGPPMHRHPWETWSVVLEGTVRVCVEDELYDLGPGDCAYTQPDVPHTFMAVGGPAKVIDFNYPGGGFEPMMREVAPMFTGDAEPDFAAVAAKAATFDVVILGPPLSAMSPEATST